MPIDALLKVVSFFREALSKKIYSSDYVDVELRNFPGGACEITSTMLGLYLVELGYSNIVMQRGKRAIPNDINSQNHVWLVLNDDIVIDVTADQFEDFSEEVFVGTISAFHQTFTETGTNQLEYSLLGRPATCGYYKFYQELLQFLIKYHFEGG